MKRAPLLGSFLVLLLACGCVVNPVPTPSSPTALENTDKDFSPDGGVAAGTDASVAAEDAVATSGGTDAGAAEPTTLFVPATATDPAVDAKFGQHFVAAPVGPPTGKLVVFLPGTGGMPKHYTRIVTEAARLGHHALGLAYANAPAVGVVCGEDAACYGPVRQEILEGVDHSPKVQVGPSDGLVHRLTRALQHLDQQRPGEGWGQFLDGQAPKWSLLVVAGHSQGAGHAAFVAKQFAVARVAMFAGVVDATSQGPAAWIGPQHATPASQYRGFVHVGDTWYAKIVANWQALGLQGLASVDGQPPPWGQAHGLTTAAKSDVPHGSVVTDTHTPLGADGAPAYRLVWGELLGK